MRSPAETLRALELIDTMIARRELIDPFEIQQRLVGDHAIVTTTEWIVEELGRRGWCRPLFSRYYQRRRAA